MDKKMKKALSYMNAQENASSHWYDFDDDLEAIASAIGSDKEAARLCIRRLEKYEYVTWIKDQNGRTLRFSLDHKGLNWKEYRRQEIITYLKDNWIDFLAMLVALAALGISYANAKGLF